MLSRLALTCGIVLGATVHPSTQDPTKTLPESYKVAFENDYVRVVRVHYDAGARLPEHTHPAGTTVYVYLNDSEGVTFSHSGNINRTVTRPPVKAGALRIASGPEEHHTAENPASTPSDFLRIWFKTDNGGERNLRRRLSPTDQEFANKQLRITRLTGRDAAIEAPATTPVLAVSLPDGAVQWVPAGERWLAGNSHSRAEVLRIDFLTSPR
jgi:hypothetical protein